jgi:EAL domain-containing protein (putative c-di-GMP-specific phosphodiesterase class I)
VNLSPRQLQDDELVAKVGAALEAAGLPGRRLQVEITESLLMKDSELAERRLSEIRSLGAGIALDDFGTGYSSLAYLHHYPVDALKIDQRFVGPLADGPRPAALVKSIIELARALDVTTVAEGVERPEQARILAELGCYTAQGTYLCQPLTTAQLDALLDEQLEPRAAHRVVS